MLNKLPFIKLRVLFSTSIGFRQYYIQFYCCIWRYLFSLYARLWWYDNWDIKLWMYLYQIYIYLYMQEKLPLFIFFLVNHKLVQVPSLLFNQYGTNRSPLFTSHFNEKTSPFKNDFISVFIHLSIANIYCSYRCSRI